MAPTRLAIRCALVSSASVVALVFALSLAMASSPSPAHAQTGRSLPSDYRLSLDAGWRTTVSHEGGWYRQLKEADFERRTQGPSLGLSLAGYPTDGIVLGARGSWEWGRGHLEGRGALDGGAPYTVQRIGGLVFLGPALHPSLSFDRWMELAAEFGIGMMHDRFELRDETQTSYAMGFEVALVLGWTWLHGGFGLRAAVSRSFFGEMGPQDLSTDVATVHLQLRGDVRW